MSSLYYDENGAPMEMMEWARKFESRTHIARDECDDVQISTVWLGLNHNFGDGPPLIFETMIFGGEHDQLQWRYATKEQAELGHAAALELVRREKAE